MLNDVKDTDLEAHPVDMTSREEDKNHPRPDLVWPRKRPFGCVASKETKGAIPYESNFGLSTVWAMCHVFFGLGSWQAKGD